MQTEEYKNAESTISNVQIYEIDLSKCGHQLTAVNIKKKTKRGIPHIYYKIACNTITIKCWIKIIDKI